MSLMMGQQVFITVLDNVQNTARKMGHLGVSCKDVRASKPSSLLAYWFLTGERQLRGEKWRIRWHIVLYQADIGRV